MLNFKTIKSKFVGAVLVIALALTVVIMGFIYFVVGGMLTDEVYERITTIAGQSAGHIDGWFIEQRAGIDTMANVFPTLQDDTSRREALLTLGTYVGFSNSHAIFGFDFTPPDGWCPTVRPWYINAMENRGSTVFTRPFIDAHTGELIISASRHIGQIEGHDAVYAIDLFLTEVIGLVGDTLVIEGSKAFLVDPNNYVIMHTFNEALLPTRNADGTVNFINMHSQAPYRQFLSAGVGPGAVVRVRADDGNHWHLSYQSINEANWRLFFGVPEAYVTSVLFRLMLNASMFWIPSIILIIVLIWYTTDRVISRPITKLKLTAQNITKGNLNAALKMRDNKKLPNDEIGQLTRNMYDLTDVVQAMTADMTKFNHETNVIGDIEYRVDASKYQGAYKEIFSSLNNFTDEFVRDMLVLINGLGSISEGDFNMQINNMPGKKMILPTTMRAVCATLEELCQSVVYLTQSAADGNFEAKVDEQKFKGSWATLIHTLNDLMETVETPLSQIEQNMELMAKGDFTRLEGDFKGIFNKVKQACNFNNKTTLSYISEIANVLEKMAQGDLTVSINREYIGSYAAIKTALTTIVESLNKTMSSIQSATNQVVAGAGQINNGAMQLADGSSRQSASIQELTASMQIIDQKAKESAANAANANERAANSTAFAKQGDALVTSMLSSIDKVKASSTEISKIIKVISDIAFQTNLLALNAAVEAARAGEQGKGFSVVAEEVRNLAGKSQQSTDETTIVIDANGQNADNVQDAAKDVADSFSTIASNINQMSGIITTIVKMSREQADSISTVNANIGEISKVVQDNSATAQESAAASEELNAQAEMLQQLVSFFRLK
ncbi:MAG: methyl-accepting chemotaxis protein [Defluviitaleaceae bacterium]|nr:methyl-accepting chemotaxis protein [Defluviitaleaceae bacterium]MCL2240087.1 methyl-accepting chemotaxis protein [Defluviitaleaceae bacterium]